MIFRAFINRLVGVRRVNPGCTQVVRQYHKRPTFTIGDMFDTGVLFLLVGGICMLDCYLILSYFNVIPAEHNIFTHDNERRRRKISREEAILDIQRSLAELNKNFAELKKHIAGRERDLAEWERNITSGH